MPVVVLYGRRRVGPTPAGLAGIAVVVGPLALVRVASVGRPPTPRLALYRAEHALPILTLAGLAAAATVGLVLTRTAERRARGKT